MTHSARLLIVTGLLVMPTAAAEAVPIEYHFTLQFATAPTDTDVAGLGGATVELIAVIDTTTAFIYGSPWDADYPAITSWLVPPAPVQWIFSGSASLDGRHLGLGSRDILVFQDAVSHDYLGLAEAELIADGWHFNLFNLGGLFPSTQITLPSGGPIREFPFTYSDALAWHGIYSDVPFVQIHAQRPGASAMYHATVVSGNSVYAVPEPTTLLLTQLGIAGLLMRVGRRAWSTKVRVLRGVRVKPGSMAAAGQVLTQLRELGGLQQVRGANIRGFSTQDRIVDA